MPASAETRAAADLVRAEQLAALGGAQPVAALAGVQPVTAPIDYNVPYSPAPVAPVAPVAPPPISTAPAPGGPGSQNFFGNDPALGLTSQDVPRYSLLESAGDVASSGNTYAVGTGPRPELGAGVYPFIAEPPQAAPDGDSSLPPEPAGPGSERFERYGYGPGFGKDPNLGPLDFSSPRPPSLIPMPTQQGSHIDSMDPRDSHSSLYAYAPAFKLPRGSDYMSQEELYGPAAYTRTAAYTPTPPMEQHYQEGSEGRTVEDARRMRFPAGRQTGLDKYAMGPDETYGGRPPGGSGLTGMTGPEAAMMAAAATAPVIGAAVARGVPLLAEGAAAVAPRISAAYEGALESILSKVPFHFADGTTKIGLKAMSEAQKKAAHGWFWERARTAGALGLGGVGMWAADQAGHDPVPRFVRHLMNMMSDDEAEDGAEDLPQPRGEQPRAEVAEGPADIERRMATKAYLEEQDRLKGLPHPGFRRPQLFPPPTPQDQAMRNFREYKGQTSAEQELLRRGVAGLADRGRYGDSMLVHMAPEEVAGLASLTQNGVTINPETGLPEMFNLRSILPTIVGIGAGFLLPPVGAAIASGLATAAVSEGTASERIGKGLLAGIGSWGMGKLTGMLGGAGAAATPGALQGVESFGAGGGELGQLGSMVIDRTGNVVPWGELPTAAPGAREWLVGQGINTEQLYAKAMDPIQKQLLSQTGQGKFVDFMPKKALGPAYNPASESMLEAMSYSPSGEFMPEGLKVGGKNVWQRPYSLGQRQTALASGLDPLLKPAQAAAAYERTGLLGERFDLGKRLGYIGEGLGQVDLTSWKPTAPGRLGLGDIATPAAASLAGFGAMLPEEEYKVSGRSTYDDQGPYFPAERRRRRLPPGYIPGVSPQLPYFAAMGGTRGKTVSGGLPTIYARGGMDGSSVMVGGERIPRSYGEGKKHVELAYVTPDEQRLLRDVDMYDSNPPHPGPAGIPNFNTGGDDPGESTDPSIGEAEGAAMAEATASVAADMATEGRPFGWFESVNRAAAKAAQVNPNAPPGENWGYGHTAMMNLQQPANTVEGMISRGMAGSMGILGGFAAEQAGKAGLSVEDPSFAPGVSEIGGPSATDLLPPTASTLLDTDEEERRVQEEEERQRMLALPVGQTLAGVPPASYRPGIDPQFSYFAQRGTEGMTIEENIDVETATEMPAGVAATSGIMQGAPVAVQDDVGARLSERQAEEPQNPRERAIYDRAVLALQNELEPEVAQRAIDEFLEVFGPEALHMLQEMVRGERENGGTVETFSGETTIAEGELQGPDVIAGKIVDPVTGEETANLRVGENEYIEPADSLARRAQVAGLPPTPENGAMLRGQEERMLRQAVG